MATPFCGRSPWIPAILQHEAGSRSLPLRASRAPPLEPGLLTRTGATLLVLAHTFIRLAHVQSIGCASGTLSRSCLRDEARPQRPDSFDGADKLIAGL